VRLQHIQLCNTLLHKIPWGHNVRTLDDVNNPAELEWYLRATLLQHGWSRNVLVRQIESGLIPGYSAQSAPGLAISRILFVILRSGWLRAHLGAPLHVPAISLL
jgi:hypothetical protein